MNGPSENIRTMSPKLVKRMQTFVFLDFETTGLPNDAPMRATELSMLAIDRAEYEDAANSFSLHSPRLPRVQNKLTLCFNPLRSIHYRASEMTGLSNENTKNQPPFDPSASLLIKAFIRRFAKPLCLIAHNGRRFDFPLLVSETSELDDEWGDDVYCADSMTALRELEYYAHASIEMETNRVFQTSKSWGPSSIVHTSPNKACTVAAPTIPVLPCRRNLRSVSAPEGRLSVLLPPSVINEFTISGSQSCNFSGVLDPAGMEQPMDLVTESHVTESLGETIVENNGLTEIVQKRVDVEETNVTMIKSQGFETVPINRRQSKNRVVTRKNFGSVSLPKLYERLFGEAPDGSHGAEDDVKSMALCCLAVKEPFLQWIDENATPFKDVKGFW